MASRSLFWVLGAPLFLAGPPRVRPMLHGTAVVDGQVNEERSGRAVPRSLVRIPSAHLSTMTDSLGRFRFAGVSALPSGHPDYADTTVLVVVRHLGYFPEQRELLVRTDERNTIQFALRADPRPVQ